MLLNYIRIAFRNFRKNKFYSFLNITGLSIALAVFIITGLFVSNEASYDNHISGNERIFRIVQNSNVEMFTSMASLPPGTGNAIKLRFPELEAVTELGLPNRSLFTLENEPFYLNEVISIDTSFFEVFDFEVLFGDAEKSLQKPDNIILTKSTAFKIFGEVNPIGSILNYEGKVDLTVAAVVSDPPSNTHFSFEALLSLSTNQLLSRAKDIQWPFFNGGYVYVKLIEGSSANNFEKNLQQFEKNSDKPEWMGNDTNLAIQPLKDIHLGAVYSNEISQQGNTTYLYLFSAIAILLLSLACINYMNLSSAQAVERSREIGVRKTFGAKKNQLVLQFLIESVLICSTTLPISVMLVEGFLPYINSLLDLQLTFIGSQYLLFISLIPLVIIVLGIISGSYSAFYLSSLNPNNAFKNKNKLNGSNILSKVLITFQFSASLFLIIATITVFAQLRFVQEKDLGFDKDYVVLFSTGVLGDEFQTFKSLLEKESSILSVTSGPPAGLGFKSLTFNDEDKESGKKLSVVQVNTDYDYIETLGLVLKEGRQFSIERSTDINASVILNEKAVKAFNLFEDPIGEIVTLGGEKREVIGIIQDYHNSSLFAPIQPLVLNLNPGNNWYGLAKISGSDINEGVSSLTKAWKEILPNRPFEFTFLDERINAQYKKDQRLASLFSTFAIIALVVACLGLLGLTAFSAKKRVKEIGIRKVLGASSKDIIALLSTQFMKLVILGLLIAIPVSWYGINYWLSSFEYGISVQYWIFLLAATPIIVITMLTVVSQSIRASLANPVDSLRSE